MSKLTSNNKAIAPLTSAPPLPRLVYYDGTKKLYYPLITVNGSLIVGDYEYSYVKSLVDTFGVALDNTKYVVPNKVVAQQYDIPAGTYSPSTFKNLIQSFISNNGSRTVKNSFSVTVNGQTLSIAAGTTIYYTTQGSSPWYAKAVCFGTRHFQAASCESGKGFSNYKSYIVETSNSPSYTSPTCFNRVFRNYASFNITVSSPGIKFS